MKDKIKRLFLGKFLDIRLKFFKNNNTLCNFPEKIKSLKKVLIVMPSDEKVKMSTRYFISELHSIFQDVKVVTFMRDSLRENDVNWMGSPNDEFMKNLQNSKFDLVVDLNPKHDKTCSYLCAFCGAPLRLNLTPGKYDHIYNLNIRTDQSKPLLDRLENILIYLKKFKTAV